MRHITQLTCQSALDQPHCVSGFIDGEVFEYVANATQLTNSTFENIFPIYIMCRGATIKKWIIGAKFPISLVNITIYEQFTFCHRQFTLNSLHTTSYLNVYEYELDEEVTITNNTRYRIGVMSTQIYNKICALSNCADQPLVTVELGSKFVFIMLLIKLYNIPFENVLVVHVPVTSLNWRN